DARTHEQPGAHPRTGPGSRRGRRGTLHERAGPPEPGGLPWIHWGHRGHVVRLSGFAQDGAHPHGVGRWRGVGRQAPLLARQDLAPRPARTYGLRRPGRSRPVRRRGTPRDDRSGSRSPLRRGRFLPLLLPASQDPGEARRAELGRGPRGGRPGRRRGSAHPTKEL
ncbi:MAG: hypothetical protein AVDCRST_MAG80-408, partial [uncultured Rubrobacteraceae bacterium]